jgi:hypothetical protein
VPRAHSSPMVVWFVVTAFAGFGMLAATGALQLRRYCRTHVTAQLAIRHRGLFVSRTADGFWWRLRPVRCGATGTVDWGRAAPRQRRP